MSKDLEAFNEIIDKFAEQMMRANKEELTAINKTNAIEYLYRTPQVRLLQQSLQRLEAIDNSNPSEALECLEELKHKGIDNNGLTLIKTSIFKEDISSIKQALLKVQEPRHYLTWEDLEFDAEEQKMKVSLNGNIHLLCYYRNMFGNLCMIDNTGITIWEENKQFFNDLHLEVVEDD